MNKLVLKKDIRDIIDTRGLRGADCWTDHTLLRCKASFCIREQHKKQKCPSKKLDVHKLKAEGMQEAFASTVREKLEGLNLRATDCSEAWAAFRDAVMTAAETTLGYRRKKHQDWFDDSDADIMALIEQKRQANAAWLSDKSSNEKHAAFKELRQKVQLKTREMKDKWWAAKAAELQSYAELN